MLASRISSMLSDPPLASVRPLPLTWVAALTVNLAIWAAIVGAARALL